jgi:GT2 family glycosyltransferase
LARLSIVIPVYDNWWLTARCLRELERLRASIALSFETIVVDNASSDETPEEIAGFPWVRYRRHETNRNFAGACNAGAAMAEAPLVLFLNNDAYPLGDAFVPMVRAFDRPEVVIAGGALFFEDGATQAAGLVVLPNAHWHYSCRNLPASLDSVNATRDALGVSGAAMAVRREWFLADGGFDESYLNGFEDVDLCMRARAQKREIAYVATSRFAHYEAASAGRFDRERENERRFYQRWGVAMGALPRIQRGAVGAVAVRAGTGDPLRAAARADLVSALRGFGHPVVDGAIPRWRGLDRRFRNAASIAWFGGSAEPPAIVIAREERSGATIRTRGVAEIRVPWLPCAALERIGACGVVLSSDPSCTTIGIAGDPPGGALETGSPSIRITAAMLLGGNERVEVACVVHCGLTDDAAFGNVLLAQTGVPVVSLDRQELRGIFAADVALFSEPETLGDCVARFVSDVRLRESYGRLIAADSRRRFSPRRSAIRVVDLLCAAQFGLERPAAARSNTPL